MKFHHLLILPIVVTGFVACTAIHTESTTSTKIQQGVPGGEVVQTTKVRATVTGIDAAKRKLTLVTPKGEKLVVKAGPEVVNFPQIRIGDQLKVTLTEELVVRMARPGEKSQDGSDSFVGIAPVGAKPGAMAAETHQVTATVTAIDQKTRKATLQVAGGATKTITVRKDVDLTKHKVGEKVVIRLTEVFAIMIEKP